MEERYIGHQGESDQEGNQCHVTIDMLPDDTLLEIFSFYREETMYNVDFTWMWEILVHVCRRWRNVIFASPRRLDLRLLCSNRTPVKTSLDMWPPLPIAIRYSREDEEGEENIIAALEQCDRVTEIALSQLTCSVSGKFAALMQLPFPALTYIFLASNSVMVPVLPEAFLGGSAPCLKTLILDNIAFPALPNLLLSSASHLVTLWLGRIPPVSGYISPAAMATCLAALPNLEELHIDFRSSAMRQSQTVPPSPPYIVLPAVTSFCFKGDGEYLEDLVGRIDTPMVQTISITLHGGRYHLPQLYPFVCRAGRLETSDQVVVEFDVLGIYLKFKPSDNFQLAVTCYSLARQVSSMAQLCRELSPLLSGVERLYLHGKRLASQPSWENVIDPPWLELFQLFVAVKRLYVSKKLGPIVATALKGFTGERSTEVFPELRSLFLEELQLSHPAQEATRPFVASRKVLDRPVDVFCWVRELGKSSDFGVQWADE